MNRLGLAVLSLFLVPVMGTLATVFIAFGAPIAGLCGKPCLKNNGNYVQMSYLKNLGVAIITSAVVAVFGFPVTAVFILLAPIWCLFAENLNLKIGNRTYRL